VRFQQQLPLHIFENIIDHCLVRYHESYGKQNKRRSKFMIEPVLNQQSYRILFPARLPGAFGLLQAGQLYKPPRGKVFIEYIVSPF